MRVPYFSRSETVELITDIAKSDELTVIAGAGCSVDWGLPTWYQLLRRLLFHEVADQLGITDASERAEFADGVLRSHDYVGAASIVRETLDPPFFNDALRNRLYQSREGQYGNFALVLADLFFTWNAEPDAKIRILTTNWDSSFEDALNDNIFALARNQQKIKKAKPVADESGAAPFLNGTEQSRDTIPVFHLHGLLPVSQPSATKRRVPQGALVFSEQDYARAIESSSWQEELLRTQLANSAAVCLFVGMSLADPNVVRHLLSIAGDARRLALLPRQDDPAVGVGPVARKLETATGRRLEGMGILQERPDFHFQLAQLVNEATLCRQAADTKQRNSYATSLQYKQRLDGWRDLMEEEGRVNTSSDKKFGRIQQINGRMLWQVRRLIFTTLRNNVRRREGVPERFALQLWARHPRSQSLELWGSSESAWFERETLLSVEVQENSPYSAVRTLCRGTWTRSFPPEEVGSRWDLSFDQPVILREGGWRHLPVGVVSLRSDAGRDSCLSEEHLSRRLQTRLLKILGLTGQLLLTPGVNVKNFTNEQSHFETADHFERAAEDALAKVWSRREPAFARARSASWRDRSGLAPETLG